MSLIEKSLAHYSITSQIVKGGMGEVYKAKDQKLGSDVAIKFLPGKSARDAEHVAPFERETNYLLAIHARAF
jgi:serine/threonine protein kinase